MNQNMAELIKMTQGIFLCICYFFRLEGTAGAGSDDGHYLHIFPKKSFSYLLNNVYGAANKQTK